MVHYTINDFRNILLITFPDVRNTPKYIFNFINCPEHFMNKGITIVTTS